MRSNPSVNRTAEKLRFSQRSDGVLRHYMIVQELTPSVVIGGGSEYICRYIDTTVRLDEAATNFRIHAGLMEALGLKKFRRGDAPIEPADV